jgi:hypothetical protein
VALQISSPLAVEAIELNQAALPTDHPTALIGITNLLQPHNTLAVRLRLDVGQTMDPSSSILDVRLVITP